MGGYSQSRSGLFSMLLEEKDRSSTAMTVLEAPTTSAFHTRAKVEWWGAREVRYAGNK